LRAVFCQIKNWFFKETSKTIRLLKMASTRTSQPEIFSTALFPILRQLIGNLSTARFAVNKELIPRERPIRSLLFRGRPVLFVRRTLHLLADRTPDQPALYFHASPFLHAPPFLRAGYFPL
jgi:hypothetical protein